MLTTKQVERIAWYFKNSQCPTEQKDAVRTAFILAGTEGVQALARMVGRNYKKLVKIGELGQLRRERNRYRRGRGPRPTAQDDGAEVAEAMARGKIGDECQKLRGRRDTNAKTIKRVGRKQSGLKRLFYT